MPDANNDSLFNDRFGTGTDTGHMQYEILQTYEVAARFDSEDMFKETEFYERYELPEGISLRWNWEGTP